MATTKLGGSSAALSLQDKSQSLLEMLLASSTKDGDGISIRLDVGDRVRVFRLSNQLDVREVFDELAEQGISTGSTKDGVAVALIRAQAQDAVEEAVDEMAELIVEVSGRLRATSGQIVAETLRTGARARESHESSTSTR